MNYSKITKYDRCDVLVHKNDVQKYGYPKTKTEGEMIDLAVANGCNIIIKNGYNGKWYLKGKGYSVEHLTGEISQRLGKSREGVYCILIE